MNKKGFIALICLTLLTSSCCYFVSKYVRQNRKRKLAGGGSGDVFAPNYDTKTVITITGKVTKAEAFVAEPMRIKAVRVFVKANRKTYEAHLGPVWYIKKQDFKLEPGDKIKLTGSRIDSKIMIQQFEHGGRTFVLRNQDGQPKWFKSLSTGAR